MHLGIFGQIPWDRSVKPRATPVSSYLFNYLTIMFPSKLHLVGEKKQPWMSPIVEWKGHFCGMPPCPLFSNPKSHWWWITLKNIILKIVLLVVSTPLKNICGMISPNAWKHMEKNKCFKPPTSRWLWIVVDLMLKPPQKRFTPQQTSPGRGDGGPHPGPSTPHSKPSKALKEALGPARAEPSTASPRWAAEFPRRAIFVWDVLWYFSMDMTCMRVVFVACFVGCLWDLHGVP